MIFKEYIKIRCEGCKYYKEYDGYPYCSEWYERYGIKGVHGLCKKLICLRRKEK